MEQHDLHLFSAIALEQQSECLIVWFRNHSYLDDISQPVTRSFAPELASSQAAFTPNTTSEALLTQQDLAKSDEPHEHQHQDGT